MVEVIVAFVGGLIAGFIAAYRLMLTWYIEMIKNGDRRSKGITTTRTA